MKIQVISSLGLALSLNAFEVVEYDQLQSKTVDSKNKANQVLKTSSRRVRRSNTDIFEELQAADITRECIDERCVFEEAREYYEDDAKTRSFWNKQTRSCHRNNEKNSCDQQGTKKCRQGWGSHTCECKKGFSGKNCANDIDECELSESTLPRCGKGYQCVNLLTGDSSDQSPHGYTCKIMGKGWKETSKTESFYGIDYSILMDVDECNLSDEELEGRQFCSEMQQCVNTEGGFKCVCKVGYSENEETNCVDIDECQDSSSCADQFNTECSNNEGSFTCECKHGYSNGFGDQAGDTCEDQDECELLTDTCDPLTTQCENIDGGFNCNCRYAGYRQSDLNDLNTQICVDIDECAEGTNEECPTNAYCNNLDAANGRSHECLCDAGFSAVIENSTLVFCSECGFEFGFPELFNVVDGDGMPMPDLVGASQVDICSLEINMQSCKEFGAGISVAGRVESSGCKCDGEEADDDQCIGDQSKDVSFQCQCSFAACAFTEWTESACELELGVECGKPDAVYSRSGRIESVRTCHCPDGNAGTCEKESDDLERSDLDGASIYYANAGETETMSDTCPFDCRKLWAQQCDYDPTLDQFFNKIVVTTQIEDFDQVQDMEESGLDYVGEEYDDNEEEFEDDEESNEEGSGQVRRSLFDSRQIRHFKTHSRGGPRGRGKRQTAVKQNTPYMSWEYEGQCSETCGDGLVKQVRKCKPFCDTHCDEDSMSEMISCVNMNGHPQCNTCYGEGSWSEWSKCMPNMFRTRRREHCNCIDAQHPECFQEEPCTIPTVPQMAEDECAHDSLCQKCQQLCVFNETMGGCGCACLPGFELHCDEVTCKKIEGPEPVSTGCPGDDWFKVGGYCYKASEKILSYTEAVDYCAEHGANVATITDREQNFWVGYQFEKNTDVYWIGLTNGYGDVNGWNWQDGSSTNFTRWFDSHPTDEGQNRGGTCVMANWSFEGEWYSLQCAGYKAKAACSIPV